MPVTLPAGIEVKTEHGLLTVKGGKGSLSVPLPSGVAVRVEAGQAWIDVDNSTAGPAIGGTMRAHLSNMVHGIGKTFEKRLALVGVGYRAQAQGKKLNLSLGFSHPVEFVVPEGIQIDTPSQTEIVVKGADRHMVGQVAANIRRFRPPEPYKGKGVRYVDEHVVMKEAKKK